MKRLWLLVTRLDWVQATVLWNAFVGIVSSVLTVVSEMKHSPYWGFFWACIGIGALVFGLLFYDALQQRAKRQKELEEAIQYHPPNVYGVTVFVPDERLGGEHL